MPSWESLISELLIIKVELPPSLGANHHNDCCSWKVICQAETQILERCFSGMFGEN